MEKKLLAHFSLAFLLALAPLGCSKAASQREIPVQKVQQEAEKEKPATISEQREKTLPGVFLAMVDNHPKARPQSGLDKADIVYEIIAEGGITRYLALYYSQEVPRIGPIRSARYYYVQLAKGYEGVLAHAGGNENALSLIPELKVKNLDEIYNASASFWRDRERKMPHNLYTSTEKLVQGAQEKKYSLVPLPALPEGTQWKGPAHGTEVTFDYTRDKYTYRASWYYNGQQYERKINGQPHLMEDKSSIVADNIIVMVAKTKDVMKKELESDVQLIGKGEARFLIAGKIMEGTWEKTSPQAPLRFLDTKGQPMEFKKGKTWLQVIPQWNKASFD